MSRKHLKSHTFVFSDIEKGSGHVSEGGRLLELTSVLQCKNKGKGNIKHVFVCVCVVMICSIVIHSDWIALPL